MDTATKVQPRKITKSFSPLYFLFTIIVTLTLCATLLRFVSPHIWNVQITSSLGKLVIVFIIAHFVCSFLEYFFHRYIFHTYPLRFLKHFYKQHTLHHGLTYIRLTKKTADSTVASRYPIVKEKQFEASYFPWHSLSSFVGLSIPSIILLQWLFPNQPIVFGTILAISWSLILYELIHAVEHLPYETFWKKHLARPRWGRLYRALYSFHVRHHANVGCNEAVGGFFGIPVPDFLFGTFMPSRIVLVDGAKADKNDVADPKPCGIIRLLDAWAARRMEKHKTAA